MMETEVRVKIPRERIGVLIGRQGKVKQLIERQTRTSIEVDSETGEVTIKATPQTNDPILVLKARDIVRAIGRGFSPERAMWLLDEDKMLDVINLKEYVGSSKKALTRVKGRIIGRDGKTRRIIEETTDTLISVYGHTVAIIGSYEGLRVAREAIEMLLKGARHATVYRFLERERLRLKKAQVELWEKPGETGKPP